MRRMDSMSPAASDHPVPVEQPSPLHGLLNRPPEQRLREYKYRFAQAVVFGLPVVALELFGARLGGPDPGRWSGLFQAILSGWVLYVGAAGMLFEGLLLLPRRLIADLPISAVAAALYLLSLLWLVHTFTTGTPHPRLFHVCVILTAVWTGIQWFCWSRRLSGLR